MWLSTVTVQFSAPDTIQMMTAEKSYEIRAAVVRVELALGKRRLRSYPRVGHHFWVLVEVSGNTVSMVESLHGLATRDFINADGILTVRVPQPIDTWHSYLQLYNVPSLGRAQDPHLEWTVPAETYIAYSETDALTRWRRAEDSLPVFNALRTPYSFCGIGKSLGFVGCTNSNSAYASAAALLGLEPHRFEHYAAPGLKSVIHDKVCS